MIRPLLLLALIPALSAQEPPRAPAPVAAPGEQILQRPEPERFAELFRRFRTEHAALSPDGLHLAYSVREAGAISVVIFAVDQPDKVKARVQVVDDDAATPMLAQNQWEKTPGRIRWMKWVTPTRIVVETNQVHHVSVGGEGTWSSLSGVVLGFDADGSNFRKLATPGDVQEFMPETSPDSDYSIRRGASRGFRTRVWLPNDPVQPTDGGGVDGAAPGNQEGTGEIATTPANASSLPSNLRIFDLDPRRPGAVTLVSTGTPRVTGSHRVALHSLDAQTGKLTDLTSELVSSTRHVLLDRQGRPRLALPASMLSSFPFRYEYYGPAGRSRPRPLEEAAGLPGFSVAPGNYFGERAIPLGFDEDANLLYYAANHGRDTFGLYSFNLATKQRGALALENPLYDLIDAPAVGFPDGSNLVFDRYSHQLAGVRYQGRTRTAAWLRPEWQAVQADLEQSLPGRCVDLIDWDEAGRRFLVSTEGPADPGTFFLYDREQKTLREFVRRAPWIDAHHGQSTLPFGFTTTDGTRLSGLITVPRQPRMSPIPMVVLCPDQPWQRVPADFQTEVHALAAMGFAVVQLNGRGAWGFGLKHRQALTAGYDLVQIEDIVTTIAVLEKLYRVNPKRVALMGRGHGGFIALRALQTYPDKFRCAVAVEAPVDPGDWLAKTKWNVDDVQPHLTRAWLGDAARLQVAPLVRQPETVTKPVLLLSYPGPDGEMRRPLYLLARRFAADVRKHGTPVEFGELRPDYMLGLPAARAQVFDQIEAFLNLNVYDYAVKLHDLNILKETTP